MKKLESSFAGRSFSAAEAVRTLKGYRPGTSYRLLSDLVQKGKITKLGYGVYSTEPRETKIGTTRNLPSDLEKARKLLSEAGIEFMVTGYSLLGFFVHLFPRRILHLIYTVPGAGESVSEVLEKAGFKTLVNPKNEREVSLALDLVQGDLFVIREMSELYGNEGGVASIERAATDLYFESTRRKIPFSTTETGRILRNIIRTGDIDFSKLTKCASRRGVDKEFRAILKAEGMELPRMGKLVANKYVKSVLADT